MFNNSNNKVEKYKTHKPKKEFNITKFKFSCDDTDGELRDANLPATYNHMWIITAKPRQGKSTYMMNLISLAKEHIKKDPELLKDIQELEKDYDKAQRFINKSDRFKRLFL